MTRRTAYKPAPSLSKPQIIALAACHRCCARRGEQCTFTREEDPHNLQYMAKNSHVERIKLAREIFNRPLDILGIKL